MADYIIQKATEFDKQSAAYKKMHSLDELAHHSHIGQRKYDGCHMVVRTEMPSHGGYAQSRTGELVKSCDHIVQACNAVFGIGWVIFGEVWQLNTKFPEISGAFRRHAPQPQLLYVVYDIVSHSAYEEGYDPVPYDGRMKHLCITLRKLNIIDSPLVEVAYYPPGTYVPQQLANQLVAEGGYDGLIMRNMNAPWTKGTARDGELIKVKPVMSFDLLVTGVEEGEGKMAGMAGNLVLDYKGKPVRAGGLDYDTRRAWLSDPSSIIGKIVEVECIGITEDGSLREPRIKGVRHDKLQPD